MKIDEFFGEKNIADMKRIINHDGYSQIVMMLYEFGGISSCYAVCKGGSNYATYIMTSTGFFSRNEKVTKDDADRWHKEYRERALRADKNAKQLVFN